MQNPSMGLPSLPIRGKTGFAAVVLLKFSLAPAFEELMLTKFVSADVTREPSVVCWIQALVEIAFVSSRVK